MKVFAVFRLSLQREWLLLRRQPTSLQHALLFFFMCIAFFPLTLPADPELLQQVAPGLIMIALLFSLLLASETWLQEEVDAGIVEHWVIAGFSLTAILLAKLIVLIGSVLCLLLALVPLLTIFLGISGYMGLLFFLVLCLSIPTLLCLCTLAAIFGVKIKQKSMFMALIVLPLMLPVLIFSTLAMAAGMQGERVEGYIAILAACALIALGVLPWVMAKLLRLQVE